MGDQDVDLKVTQTGRDVRFLASCGADPLRLTIDATTDALSGRMLHQLTTLRHEQHGEIFRQGDQFSPNQVVSRTTFGPSTKGCRLLALIAEGSASNVFVYGFADGRELLPSRFSRLDRWLAAEPNHDSPRALFYVGDDERVARVELSFPERFDEELRALDEAFGQLRAGYHYASPVNGGGWEYKLDLTSCFWSNVSIHFGLGACLLGCATATGPLALACGAACLAAAAAAKQSVNMSKAPGS